MNNLLIHEQFISVSGEVGKIPQGGLCTAIRLQGCNLKCAYCDAEKAITRDGGYYSYVPKIVTEIQSIGLPLLLTGGEPLLQKDAVVMLIQLLHGKTLVQIETNGTVDIAPFRLPNVSFVMDYKFSDPPTMENIRNLRPEDILKFVVSSKVELDMAIDFIEKNDESRTWTNAISSTELSLYQSIIRAIRYSSPETLVNVQIHKTIGVQ